MSSNFLKRFFSSIPERKVERKGTKEPVVPVDSIWKKITPGKKMNLEDLELSYNEEDEKEIRGLLNELNEKMEELQKEFDAVLGKGGITAKQIEEYMRDSSNFSDSQKQILKNLEKENEKKLQPLLPKAALRSLEKKKAGKKKKLKRRSMGSRKGWIQMD